MGFKDDVFIQELEALKNEIWLSISTGPFWNHMTTNTVSKDLYVATMSQIFHYIQHTPRSQALAGILSNSENHKLARFAYHHSYEEVGHEHMVINDLQAIGISPDAIEEHPPLPETETFIGYVYYASVFRGAKDRLGLSYWIEGSYDNINPMLASLKSSLNLSDDQMSFFVKHAQLDVGHLNAVQKVIVNNCISERDKEGVRFVLKTSLTLFGAMLDGIHNRYVLGVV